MHVERLLLSLTGQAVDEAAARLAADLVRPNHGQVYALYVIQVPWQYPVDAEIPEATDRGGQTLEQVESLLKSLKQNVTAAFVQARDMGPAIVNEAIEREADLVLLGMPYKQRHGVFSMGEAIPYILRSAPCPVLVLREPIPARLLATPPGQATARREARP
ncbi:MAG: universal stress protein [Chloroflexi bacterium]|nr:universal stress protein [Chloroflexota bacterium]